MIGIFKLTNGHADAAQFSERRAPLLERVDHAAPSVFRPENMLREARRQKALAYEAVPPICVLDPDGDIVRYVRAKLSATQVSSWACYHSEMWEFTTAGVRMGVVGNTVGGAFSVLVAEQLFASRCQLLMHISSAGQIADLGRPPYYILIDRALRDEGTSYHYLPPSAYANADPELMTLATRAMKRAGQLFHTGSTWTTDAPFRETAETIADRRRAGIFAVEMEAAALYAFAAARSCPVICIAHVSNRLGAVEGDFEKGEDNGARCSLKVLAALATEWSQQVQCQDRAIAGPDPARSLAR